MKLEAKSAIQIQKPAAVVYEAIVDPQHMQHYFIANSSGRLEEGSVIKWKFPEFPDSYPVSEIKLEENKSISFVWDPETRVQISLETLDDKNTVVRVVEGKKELSEQNRDWAIENSSGWANFLTCLKAYLEHGINLRKGAFEFMRIK
jgi:uncharacterized protein YndB with AHSA1/START domain